MKLPESIGHKQAVEFVKGVLEEDLGVQLEKKKIHIEMGRKSDLVYDSPDEDKTIVVMIRDNIGLTNGGLLKKDWCDRLHLDWLLLKDYQATKKILVITDFQVYQQLNKVWYAKGGTSWRKDRYPKTEIKLIEFPVFGNNFAEKFNNESFTVNQLIGAMKFNVLKYDQLPIEIKEVMLVMLKRLGYLRKKTKKLDNSASDKK
jgi:hypothetical protein